MADSTKYMPINGGTLVSDLGFKKIFSLRTKRTRVFVYVFIAVFIGFTVFLAFNPSPNPSSPWFSNIFGGTTLRIPSSSTGTSFQANSTASSSGSAGSHFSSVYSYFFPSNSSQPTQNRTTSPPNSNSNTTASRSQTANLKPPTVDKDPSVVRNRTQVDDSSGKVEGLKQNRTESTVSTSPSDTQKNATSNRARSSSETPKPTPKNATETSPSDTQKNATSNRAKSSSETQKPTPKNATETGSRPSSEETQKSFENSTDSGALEIEDLVKNLTNCDLFDGEWVKDESYPLYEPGSCSLIDEQFNCFLNGRPDKGFQMLKWKPKGCTLPRLDGSHMLQLLKGKRLVFVGDSLNRNMWESLVCILRNSVKDRTKVYEASGRHHFRSEASYSFVFEDYKCTVEFFVEPFLVREWETKDKNGTTKETLRLDLVGQSADQYKTADVVVFNTGHWWTHEKTAKGKDYYQEGSHVYGELNVLEAFRKAMTTWGRWVDANMDPSRTSVFFRGYSASHFRGGQWNSGGQCDNEVEPIKNTTYLSHYPDKMRVMENVLRGMKTRVSYLNVTRLTDFRKDGHPSVYRKRHYTEQERRSPLHFQDCSHWCLPGVPDAWNEILYAQLLAKRQRNR